MNTWKYNVGDRVIFYHRRDERKDYNLIRERMMMNDKPSYILDDGYILYESEIEKVG
jgi:hypothetical protein